jgi:hypothetical protein
MEEVVKESFPHYTILRLGNCDWGTNPNHLMHFLREKLANDEPFEIYDVYRHPLTKDEFQYWLELIPEWNCELTVTGKPTKVQDIVNELRTNTKTNS